MTEADFRAYVQTLVDQSCGSAGALARKHKLHPKALTLFLSGARGPSAEVAAAFGFERRYMALAQSSTPPASKEDCTIPPAGWYCTRAAGHEGPCAAIPDDDLEQEIAEAIDDSLDMDWTGSVGARHVMDLLRRKGIVS